MAKFGTPVSVKASGTLQPTTWAPDTQYPLYWHVLNSGGDEYVAHAAHLSAAATQPGIGEDSADVWTGPLVRGLTAAQQIAMDEATALGTGHPPLVKNSDTTAGLADSNGRRYVTENVSLAVEAMVSPSASNPPPTQSVILVPNAYSAGDFIKAKTVSVAADRTKLSLPALAGILIDSKAHYRTAGTIDITDAANWDTVTPTDRTVAANRAGAQIGIYLTKAPSGSTPGVLLSVATDAPSGWTTSNSRKIGEFHCLATAIDHNTNLAAWTADTVMVVGQTVRPSVANGKMLRCTAIAGDAKTHAATEPTTVGVALGTVITDDQVTWVLEQHALEGYAQGDILPDTVSCLKRMPICGWGFPMAYYPTMGLWVALYFQTAIRPNVAFAFGGTIVINQRYRLFEEDMRSVGMRMMFHHELTHASRGSNIGSGTSQGLEITTVTGASDGLLTGSKQFYRRMVSHRGVEGLIGHHHQMLADAGADATHIYCGGGYFGTTSANCGPWNKASILYTDSGIYYSCRGVCGSTSAI